jgi:hypothetical protein
MLWCWRCKAEVPMLDDEEFAQVVSKQNRDEHTTKARSAPFLDEYERITGFREANINAVWHHQISLYGPPCKSCGKPLRTPQAKLCGSCMAVR